MKGEVLHYDDNTGVGQISGADGVRYNFTRSDLKQLVPIHAGSKIDFDFEGKDAKDIYIDPSTAGAPERYSGPAAPDRGMFEYFTRCFTANFANFSGRARRKEFWSFVLFYFIVIIVGGILVAIGAAQSGGHNPFGSPLAILGIAVMTIFGIAAIIPSLALTVRRLHDIGQSGWWVLAIAVVGVIPYLGIISSIATIVIGVIDTQPIENKYGPPAKAVQR